MEPAQLKLFSCITTGSNSNCVSFLDTAQDLFMLLKKDAVSSRRQLDICYDSMHHILEKNTRYHDASAVMMMLLSGKNQISEAIDQVGITDGDREFLVACTSNDDLERFRALMDVKSVTDITGIPEDDSDLDEIIFPKMTDIIYDLRRSH